MSRRRGEAGDSEGQPRQRIAQRRLRKYNNNNTNNNNTKHIYISLSLSLSLCIYIYIYACVLFYLPTNIIPTKIARL